MVLKKKIFIDRHAQTSFFFLFMIGIVLFILAFALASPLMTNSNQVRTNLNCSNSSISTDQKVTCGIVDITTPWLIGLILALGGVAFTAKLLLGS